MKTVRNHSLLSFPGRSAFRAHGCVLLRVTPTRTSSPSPSPLASSSSSFFSLPTGQATGFAYPTKGLGCLPLGPPPAGPLFMSEPCTGAPPGLRWGAHCWAGSAVLSSVPRAGAFVRLQHRPAWHKMPHV